MPDTRTAPPRPIHPWVAEGQRQVRFGAATLGPRADWPRLRDCAQQAEALGFDS